MALAIGADALSLKRAKLACGSFLEEEQSSRMNGWFSHLAEEEKVRPSGEQVQVKKVTACPNNNDISDVNF